MTQSGRSVRHVWPFNAGRAWAVVSDVVGTSRLSDELSDVRWERRADCATVQVGDTFCSSNTLRDLRWRSRSVVTAADPGERFTFAVSGPEHPTATWSFELRPVPAGTEVTYSVELGDGPSMLGRVTDPDRRSAAERWRLDRFAESMAEMLAGLGERATRPGTTQESVAVPPGGVRVEATFEAAYPTVRTAFERRVPLAPEGRLVELVSEGASWDEVRRVTDEVTGEDTFMRYATIEHGLLGILCGGPEQVVTWLVGNYVVARQLVAKTTSAALYIPLRISLSGTTGDRSVLTFEQPSRLLSALTDDEEVGVLGSRLNATLATLVANIGADLP